MLRNNLSLKRQTPTLCNVSLSCLSAFLAQIVQRGAKWGDRTAALATRSFTSLCNARKKKRKRSSLTFIAFCADPMQCKPGKHISSSLSRTRNVSTLLFIPAQPKPRIRSSRTAALLSAVKSTGMHISTTHQHRPCSLHRDRERDVLLRLAGTLPLSISVHGLLMPTASTASIPFEQLPQRFGRTLLASRAARAALFLFFQHVTQPRRMMMGSA